MVSDPGLPRPDVVGKSPPTEEVAAGRANRKRGAARQTASKFMLFIGANWLRAASAILVGFVMAPLILGEFGIVLFGLYMLIARGTAALVNPIRVALNQLYIKAMTAATAEHDDARTSEVMTNVVVMTFTVGFIFIGLGVLLSAFAPAVIAFPEDYEIHVRTILITEAIVVALLVMRNPWLGLFLVEHRPLSYNFDMMIQRWIDPVAFGLAFIPLGFDVFSSFMVIRVVLTAANSVFRMVAASRLVPAARFRLGQVRWRTIRGLSRTGALTTAQPFSEFAFDVIDSYLLNITFGPVFNGLYSVVNSLRFYARKLGQDASMGTEAIAADMHERGQHETVVRSLLASMRLVSGIMLICSGIIAIFFGPIVDVWLGKAMSQDEELLKIMSYETAIDLAWMFVLILLVGGVLMEVSIAGSRFLYGMGLIGKYSGVLFAAGLSKVLLAASVVVLFLSPAELPYLDKTSLEATLLFPASTLLCQVFFFGFFFPRRLIRLANIPLGQYLTQVWLRPLASVVPSLAIGAIFILFIESWTIWHLFLTFIGVGLSFIPMVGFILLTPPERKQIIGILQRLLNRIRRRGTNQAEASGDPRPS